MDPKDIITIAISGAALFISLIALGISLLQKKYETERILRQQVTEVIGKLIDNTAEISKNWNQSEINKRENLDDTHVQSMFSILNQRSDSYARQAAYLIKQIPHLVSDVEYATVAAAYAGVGDFLQAEIYWLQAIEAAANGYPKAIVLRGYAQSLYTQGLPQKGAEYYERALKAYTGDSSHVHWTTGYTWQMWAISEAMVDAKVDADIHFSRAEESYRRIAVEGVRLNGIRMVEEARHRYLSNQPPPPPVQPNPIVMNSKNSSKERI